MNERAPRHPEIRTMVAFIEGRLPPGELAAVSGHLRDCRDCRTVVTETARFEREETRAASPSRRTSWWLPLAAFLATVAITVPLVRWSMSRRISPIEQLIAAAPNEHRTVGARLSGFPWARLQAPSRGGTASPDPADMKLVGAAGEVLEKANDAPESRHAAGVAYLLTGRRADAVTALERAAGASNDARVWSDLAAARHGLAVDDKHPKQLPQALADVDRALRLEGHLPEALYNRALILESMGLREAAARAWQRYLEVDAAGAWSVEAREHLRRLGQSSLRFDPRAVGQMPAGRLVRDFPQEARLAGEGPLLADWADAEGKPADAVSKLAVARGIGQALGASTGEFLLADAVEAIDRAAGTRRAGLIEAHRLYRRGRMDYAAGRAGDAQRQLRSASALFAAANSPMAGLASYYAADAALSQNRGVQARDELAALLSPADRVRHRAFVAQVHWTLAVEANSRGDWGVAVRQAEAAWKIFSALGERTNAAFADSIAAQALEMIGDHDAAWTRRVRAIGGLCGGGDRDRCNQLLFDAATTLAAVDRATAAVALADVAVEDGQDAPPAGLSLGLAKRARVALLACDPNGARASLDLARAAATRIPDPDRRQMTEMEIAVETAALDHTANPRAAIGELDRATAFCNERNLLYFLPKVYLQRARAYRSAGDDRAAMKDYRSALGEIQKQRQLIADPHPRMALVDAATQIIDELIEMHLSSGAVAAALDVADRRHGLSDLQSAGPPAATLRAPAGVAMIEYAVLPHSLVIFSITDQGLSQRAVKIERGELAALIASFAANIRRRAPVDVIKVESAALYRLLIAPASSRLAGAADLLIVPDGSIAAVPFAALYDDRRGRYLLQDFSIRLATSVVAAAPSGGALAPALVVADPSTEAAALTAGRDEAALIAALYGTTPISGEAATRERFIAAANDSALIHYTGHADSDAIDSYGALLLAGPDGTLGATDIARLSLRHHPLVVLAACGTFRGDPVHAAGMASLGRAFLIAGARAVVGTLWEIDDDVAAPLFLSFHRQLRAGVAPELALRGAQTAMLQSADARFSHPATWAPVEMLSNHGAP